MSAATMRAAVMRGDRFAVEERPRPTPGPGEVLVRVRACGVCGSDLHYFHHADSMIDNVRALGASTEAMERNLAAGPVLGHEFVCEVEDFGPDTARRLEGGARVCSMPFLTRGGVPQLIGASQEAAGAYAEYMLLTEALLLPVDPSIPDEAAALCEPLGIAVHAVNKAAMQPQDVPVIVGCGPIGLAIIAVLKARGVSRIIASDLSPKRRELAGAIGASLVVDAREQSVSAAAQADAPGAPLVFFENTGAAGMLHRLVLEAPAQARIIGAGIPAGAESFIPMLAISKELQLTFVIFYSAQEFAEALELIRQGALDWRPLVTGKVGLAGVTQAFKDLEDPERHAKILIDPWLDA
ncbi:MAG: zinc-binding dehydrogenase [Phenylobacterium sp.]